LEVDELGDPPRSEQPDGIESRLEVFGGVGNARGAGLESDEDFWGIQLESGFPTRERRNGNSTPMVMRIALVHPIVTPMAENCTGPLESITLIDFICETR
jgi:hypothetical protein